MRMNSVGPLRSTIHEIFLILSCFSCIQELAEPSKKLAEETSNKEGEESDGYVDFCVVAHNFFVHVIDVSC